ncbi:MAG: hypothetical protein IPK16_27455 [Anaerolineales bacterium]|nr:hypothetical protein [Anaerolineales bacterium]
MGLRPNEHTVVLLDELDEVFRTDSRDIAIQLRNIIESETRISWIAASTMLVKASVGKYGSPWFNLLEPIEMRNMDWASAYQLVLRLGKRVGFDWTESAVTAILELSGRRPYLMQLLGVRTTDGLNILGRSRVESSDVSAAVNQLVGEISLTGTYLGFVWNEAQWLGKLMLWHILNAADPLRAVDLERRVRQLMTKQGMALNNDRFYAAFDERLAWLTDIADALEIDSGNHVIFSIPLVKRYLERVVQREQDFLRRATAGLEAELKE